MNFVVRAIIIITMTTLKIIFCFCIVSLICSLQIQSVGYIDDKGLDLGGSTYRAIIARDNIRLIEDHNTNGDPSFQLKVYKQFIALTPLQFKALYLMKSTSLQSLSTSGGIRVQAPKFEKKTKAFYVDLSTHRHATPVQNQGACGNCYAYAIVDAVNIVNRVAGKNTPLLSPQHLTDCSKGLYYNNGCNGGSLWGGFEYQRAYGIYSNAAYPPSNLTVYNGIEQPCRTIPNAPKYKIFNWYYFNAPDCLSRINYLAQGFAIEVGVFAAHTNFMFYGGGVLPDCPYSSTIDHAVVLVGAYYDPNSPFASYYKIKNSWGTRWGEGGYIRISLGRFACNACKYGFFSSK